MTPQTASWPGLNSVVANVMHVSSIGYPFVNPGPIGGLLPSDRLSSKNTSIFFPGKQDYDGAIDDQFELYVRWMQLNTFLPMMHFLKPPSDFYNTHREILQIAKDAGDIRGMLNLKILANEAMQSSVPIIRPMWMINPHSKLAHVISDQFFLGDKILVTPILKKGQRKRDVYLPNNLAVERTNHRTENNMVADNLDSADSRSQDPQDSYLVSKNADDPELTLSENDMLDKDVVWKQMGTAKKGKGNFYKGGKWLRDVRVELDEILYFERYILPSSKN